MPDLLDFVREDSPPTSDAPWPFGADGVSQAVTSPCTSQKEVQLPRCDSLRKVKGAMPFMTGADLKT